MNESHLYATQNALHQIEAFGYTLVGVLVTMIVLVLIVDRIEKRRGDR